MNEAKLKACPFCNSKRTAILDRAFLMAGNGYNAQCLDCGTTSGIYANAQAATRGWNLAPRTGDQAPAANITAEHKPVRFSEWLADRHELEKCKARIHWLHDCSSGVTDPEGFEWGIYRVKWENGKAIEVWQTNSDCSDLDAEMARERSANAPGERPGATTQKETNAK